MLTNYLTRFLLLLILFSSVFSCKSSQKASNNTVPKKNTSNLSTTTVNNMKYPPALRGTTTDNYHGTIVADPYRWLEDENSADTRTWINAQNALTQSYLDGLDMRPQLKKRLTELWNYPKYGTPFKEGAYYYYSKNDGLQNHSVIYRQKNADDTKPDVFLDPNLFSEDGSVSLSNMFFSKDGTCMVYATSQGGSDWEDFHVIHTEPSRALPEKLQHIKFSGASWLGNEGFFYGRYPAPQPGKDLSDENIAPKIYYHALHTKQEQDQLVFENPQNPRISYYAGVTNSEKYILLYASNESASGNALYYVAADKWKTEKFKPIISHFDNNNSVIDNIGDKLLVLTNQNADRYRLVLIDPKRPEENNWEEVIPQQNDVLESVYLAGDYIVAQYMKDVSSRLYVYDKKGTLKTEISLPTLGVVTGIWASNKTNEMFYNFESFLYPPTIFRYDVSTNQTTTWRKPELKFDFDKYETRQVFYNSKDGTKIPMFITGRKDMLRNGENPTLLYSYGGFNIARIPEFKIENLPFYENGGVYAVANLRGGSEYGEAWHKAGMLNNKQNVFDDYIAAAQYLINEKYTSPNRLAATGRSNGGLLIGAVMNQRPDLFAVALPTVGVMDMLRYQKFTIGWAWASEYGSSDNEVQFKYLYPYSPYHNIRTDKPYPATLVITAERDDRVVPAHSFKYTAELQHQYKGNNPMLIRIEKQSGHASGGSGKTINARIEEYTDIWSFVFKHLGIKP